MKEPEMIPCDQVIGMLWEYIDGELTEESAGRVRAHLEICSRCFPQYDFQRAYREFVRRSALTSVPPDLRRRVFEMILEEERVGRYAGGGVVATIGSSLRRLFGAR